MGMGKFKVKPTGIRNLFIHVDIIAGISTSPKKAIFVQGVIDIQNPYLVKPNIIKARDIDIGKTSELSRCESIEIEKQRAHERYMKLQEQEKAEAAKKREEEKVRVGRKSIKNLHRKNIPYWKPFLMALRSRKKQQRSKERNCCMCEEGC